MCTKIKYKVTSWLIVFQSFSEGEISDDFTDFLNLKGMTFLLILRQILAPPPPPLSSSSLPLAVLISLEKKMDELDLRTSSKGVVKPGE